MVCAIKLRWFAIFVALAITVGCAKAQINAFSPLLTPVTSFEIETITSTVVKPTVCFVTNGNVSACRRRRAVLEEPEIIDPSPIVKIENTVAPVFDGQSKRSKVLDPDMVVSSSIDSKNYRSSLNYYRQLMSGGNLITVGPNCGGATLDFSQFMESCLGVTVQRTTTLTATFTETFTESTGYTTMTVAGCTPVGFPYPNCNEMTTSTQVFRANDDDILDKEE